MADRSSRQLLLSSLILLLCRGCGSSSSGGGPDGAPAGADAATGSDPDAGSSGVPVDARPPPPDAGPLAEIDLCDGLVQDKQAHPMTALAKPAVGAAVVDKEFGTTIRRITQVPSGGGNPAIRPVYSTVSAWNVDESLLLLYQVGTGHLLYDGRTYAPIRVLDDIDPPDLEQVYWDTRDPDLLYYVDNKTFIRYHVSTKTKERALTFDFCGGSASAGSDPMFTSWSPARLGLTCGDQMFVYDIDANQVIGRKTLREMAVQMAPSGELGFLGESARIVDAQLNVLRTLDMDDPGNHASLGRLKSGADTWNGVVFDEGPRGNDDIGSLVVFDLGTGTSRVVIGPKTGYPYPPSAHISAVAFRRPGWVYVSTYGDVSGGGLLDLENLLADTNGSTVCRVGRHRSWGKSNTHLSDAYWAEAHTVPSPSGTRAVFASDWGNGTTVDAYVLELPSYR